jgi:hypothetical protein
VGGSKLSDARNQCVRQALGLFEAFISKAAEDPKYVEAVQRSRERIEDIRVEIAFLEQGIAERHRAY